MSAVVAGQSPRQDLKSLLGRKEGQRKLPRPIVFWSLNEKSAYRRNRVVQTRMGMIIDDIATQRETSRKTIRYEAHKFRQKNNKYYTHPLGLTGETTKKGSNYNIAPPNWRPPSENRTPTRTARATSGSEDEYDDEDDDEDNDVSGDSPRKKGLITRAKKPAVSFSVFKEVKQIENDIKVDDIDEIDLDNYTVTDETVTEINPKHRALSAPIPYTRIGPELPGQKRQQSAFPSLRLGDNDENKMNDKYKTYGSTSEGQNKKVVKLQSRSENYFDRSKAAYQLRQELKRRAKLRKQGVKTTIFTLQDALNLEKEKFLKSSDKVEDYIKRIEEIKRNESTIINKWTKNEFESVLNI
ncbi:hypothetical protein ACF0H5_008554 [Mactra antiquata]